MTSGLNNRNEEVRSLRRHLELLEAQREELANERSREQKETQVLQQPFQILLPFSLVVIALVFYIFRML